jgi:vacuolar-type H+-ATPase subunit C/Vma6
MIPKIKEKWRKDAKIEVSTLLNIIENPKDIFKNEERVLSISIDKGYVKSTCSFQPTKKGKKDALKFIKEELYLG